MILQFSIKYNGKCPCLNMFWQYIRECSLFMRGGGMGENFHFFRISPKIFKKNFGVPPQVITKYYFRFDKMYHICLKSLID